MSGGAGLDDVVHQRNRLAILAALTEASKAIGFLKPLELSGNRSRLPEFLETPTTSRFHGRMDRASPPCPRRGAPR